jgi:hypothetical protein
MVSHPHAGHCLPAEIVTDECDSSGPDTAGNGGEEVMSGRAIRTACDHRADFGQKGDGPDRVR